MLKEVAPEDMPAGWPTPAHPSREDIDAMPRPNNGGGPSKETIPKVNTTTWADEAERLMALLGQPELTTDEFVKFIPFGIYEPQRNEIVILNILWLVIFHRLEANQSYTRPDWESIGWGDAPPYGNDTEQNFVGILS